jgi:DNA-binding NtrC family response regulator
MPGKSILVIDSDDNVRSTLAAILLQAGYRVVSARSVCGAIENLIDDCFDLVLLDLRISDMEGQAFLFNLHLIYPELPVMVMTAYSELDVEELEERFGTLKYFIKPIDPVLLLDSVKESFSDCTKRQTTN